jgi:hypothetical protein
MRKQAKENQRDVRPFDRGHEKENQTHVRAFDTPAPHVVEPRAVYRIDQVIALFGLRKTTVRREVREGRLRVAKRAGRHYFLGAWLLEWIEGGELSRRTPERNGVTEGARERS